MKAELRGEATGTARLFIGGGGANRDNPVENAETSAIGRALGFLGYGCFGTGIASADEMITALGGDPSRADVTHDPRAVKAAAGANTPAQATAPTEAPAPERKPVSAQPRISPDAEVFVGVLNLRPDEPDVLRAQANDDEAKLVELPRAKRSEMEGQRLITAPVPADDAQGLLEALTTRTLGRDQLATAAMTLLQVPPAGYVAYLTRTFGVRAPQSLSDAQLKKEIELLLRRVQQADQAARFRAECEKLAQQAA